MTLNEAVQVLRDHGRPTCTCKYGSQENMIKEAKKLLAQSQQQTPSQ